MNGEDKLFMWSVFMMTTLFSILISGVDFISLSDSLAARIIFGVPIMLAYIYSFLAYPILKLVEIKKDK